MGIRVRIKINYNQRSRLLGLIILTMVGATTLGYLAWTKRLVSASGQQTQLIHTSDVSLTTATNMRGYYLAKDWYLGSVASTACTSGYHLASLWEIQDTSNLKYNTNLGLMLDDSGEGPPSYLGGWIRTGYGSASSSTPGIGNCFSWTSSNNSHSGTVVYLPLDWSVGGNFNNWYVYGQQCDATMHVWCVEDVFGEKLFLPLLLKD